MEIKGKYDKNWANNGQIFHKYWTNIEQNIVRILGTYYANI